MIMRSLSYSRGNPYLLMVALAILGSGIMFLFLALIFVRKMTGAAVEPFEIPTAFSLSTIVLLLSSGSLETSNQLVKYEKYSLANQFCLITLALAIAFCWLQWLGWQSMLAQNQSIKKTFPAFVFLFTGLHFLHILIGIFGLVIITIHSNQNKHYVDGFIQTLNPAKRTFLKMTNWFWHFLDFLWLILFVLMYSFSKH